MKYLKGHYIKKKIFSNQASEDANKKEEENIDAGCLGRQQTEISRNKKEKMVIDIYSLEGELINWSKRELSNGETLIPIEKLKLVCLSRGAGGIVLLGRSFARLDVNKDSLNFYDFKRAILEAGFTEMNEKEIGEIFRDDFTNVHDFFNIIRPNLTANRINIIDQAFSKLDPRGIGSTDFTTFKNTYIVDKHPRYQNGDLSKASIYEKVLANFANNIITKEDFINYYAAISAQIEKDIYFDLLMRECYNL